LKREEYNRDLKNYKADDRNGRDAQSDLVCDRKKPELVERVFERKEFEIRDRVGVDQNSGQNEDRAIRQKIVLTEIRESDIGKRF
jgi:hypothetical protein